MRIYDILMSTPRETLENLVRAHMMKPYYLTWYDMTIFYNSLPSDLPVMERYARVAVQFGITEDSTRHVFNKMAKYI